MRTIEKFSVITQVVSLTSAVIGVVCFFAGNLAITCICAAIGLFDSFVQIVFGSQNNATTEFVAVLIGCVVAWATKTPWYIGASAALCFENVLFTIGGWLFVFISSRS